MTGGQGDVCEASGIDSRSAYALNGPSDDQGIHIGRTTADCAADFEADDPRDEQPFYVEDAVCFAAMERQSVVTHSMNLGLLRYPKLEVECSHG